MKTSTKFALTGVLVGILGISTVVQTVYASPSQKSIQVAQASDGDGEANDATEASEKVQTHHQSIQMTSNHSLSNIVMIDTRKNNKARASSNGTGMYAKPEKLTGITF